MSFMNIIDKANEHTINKWKLGTKIAKVQTSAVSVASTAQGLSASSEELKENTDQISSTSQIIAGGVSQVKITGF